MTENSPENVEIHQGEAQQEEAPPSKKKYKYTPKKKFKPGELSGKTKETLNKIKLAGGQTLTGEAIPPPRPDEVRGQKIDWTDDIKAFSKSIKDLRAKYFGKILVYKFLGTRKISDSPTVSDDNPNTTAVWKARCDCGNHIETTTYELARAKKRHCGCGPMQLQPMKKMFSQPPNPNVDPALSFARESLIAYACLQWAGYEPAAHHQLIAKYLEKVERGEIKRLMIFQPPRSGKSMLVSEYFPAWFLGKNPNKLVVTASYGQELASDFGRKVRNQIADPLFPKLFNGVTIAEDSSAIDKFNLNPPNKGGYFAVGVGGALTGRGANCLPGDTKILTNHGVIDISEVLRYNSPVMALSFSEDDKAFVWSPIVAVSRRKSYELVRVVTDRGSLTCTPEHPFYIEGYGYVEAKALKAGQGLCTCELPSLRKGISEGSACNRSVDREQQRSELLLLSSMQIRASQGRSEDSPGICSDEGMLDVREGVSSEAGICGIREVLLNEMLLSAHRSGAVESSDYRSMPILWKRLLQQGQHQTPLLKSVCGQDSFSIDDRENQPKLSGRVGDGPWNVKENDPGYSGERWAAVCCLPRNGEPSRPSYRSGSKQQYNGEYGDSLSDLPHASPQDCGKTTVRMVESLHNELVEVYDIEVFKHHNFVALNDQGTPLVLGNCLIIDDPIRSREDADSESNRRKIKDWYTAVAYTRLMPEGAIIVCQTRWHLEDLSGWLLKEHQHENWVVLNLPAINSKGEALWPERYPLETLLQIKKTLPSRDWEALYQQKPYIEEGGIFKREWWKMWPEGKKFPECSFIIQAWDTATTDKDLKSNSYSARTTWGIFQRPDDEVPNVILLEAWKDRVEFPELQKEALRAYREYEPDKVLIEKKSSGQQLIQILRRMGLPLVEFLPEKIGDKTARAYAAQNMFENGRVYYPSRRWAEEVIDDLARFSPSSPNDITDTVTSALIWLQKSWLLQHSDLKEDDDEKQQEDEDDELLPSNVRRFKPRKRSAYG